MTTTAAQTDALPTRSRERLIRNLIEVGSIAPGQVAAGLRVIDTSRPARVWIVRASDGTALVVKQATDTADRRRLAREAAIYALLRGVEMDGSFLPPRVSYHDRQGLLIMDHIGGASLADIAGRRNHDGSAAGALGQTLARLHQIPVDEATPCLDIDEPPSALRIHRPGLGWYTRSSVSSLRMRASIQHDRDLARALDALQETWRAETLIHADLKLEHVLVCRPASLAIIDWESAQRGDAAWDIGTVFAGYLLRWLRSIPLLAGHELRELANRADVPIERIQQATNAFWQAYHQGAVLDDVRRRDLLVRSIGAAAAILLQREEEYLQTVNASTSRTAMILSVSRTMLVHRLDGASVLLGLDTGDTT